MGVYDIVACKYPLPWDGAEEMEFQSKETPAQYLNHYEIREDGTLWHLAHETEWEQDDNSPCGFWMHQLNERWEQVENITGQVEIYNAADGVFYSVLFWFRDGVVRDVVPRKESIP